MTPIVGSQTQQVQPTETNLPHETLSLNRSVSHASEDEETRWGDKGTPHVPEFWFSLAEPQTMDSVVEGSIGDGKPPCEFGTIFVAKSSQDNPADNAKALLEIDELRGKHVLTPWVGSPRSRPSRTRKGWCFAQLQDYCKAFCVSACRWFPDHIPRMARRDRPATRAAGATHIHGGRSNPVDKRACF